MMIASFDMTMTRRRLTRQWHGQRDQKRWKRRNGNGDSTLRKRRRLYIFDGIGRRRIQCNRI
eukprot:7689704-Ditylum_brightwellii.AAC.1